MFVAQLGRHFSLLALLSWASFAAAQHHHHHHGGHFIDPGHYGHHHHSYYVRPHHHHQTVYYTYQKPIVLRPARSAQCAPRTSATSARACDLRRFLTLQRFGEPARLAGQRVVPRPPLQLSAQPRIQGNIPRGVRHPSTSEVRPRV